MCEVFAAVDFGVLADDVLVPHLTGGQETVVADRFEEVGSGQVQCHLSVSEDGGQVELLDVDREVVVAHLDDVFAIDEEVLSVLELSDSVLADRLQPALDVIDLDAVFEFPELVDDVADLVDHQVRGEVAVDVVDAFQRADPALDPAQDPFGGSHQRGGSLVAGLDQLQFSRLERVVDLVAFLGELHNEFVELGEPPLELLDADHDLGEELVAFFGRVADIEVVDDRLVEEFQLRVELGDAFDGHQVAGLLLECGSGLVDRREDVGDVVDDRGALGGVVDFEVADDIDEHFEVGGALIDRFLQRLGVTDLGQPLDPRQLLDDLLFIRRQRLGSQQELDAAVRERIVLCDDSLFELFDQQRVDVAKISQGDDVAADASECGQRVDEVLDRLEPPPSHVGDDRLRFALDPGRFVGGVPFDSDDFFEFVDRRGGGVADFAQWSRQAAGFLVGDPEEAVEDVGRLLDDVDVEVRVGVFLVDQPQHLVALGHAADDVLVADLVQEGLFPPGRFEAFAGIGGLPDLDRVVLGGGVLRAEADEFASFEQREPVANERGFDLLLDQVVVQQDVDAGIAVVEDIKEVLAVGRIDPAGELHVLQVTLERLVLTGLQVVPV